MTEKEKVAMDIVLRNRITEKSGQIGTAVTHDEVIWLHQDLEYLYILKSALKNGTLGKLLVADDYGQLWETWMALKGNAQDI